MTLYRLFAVALMLALASACASDSSTDPCDPDLDLSEEERYRCERDPDSEEIALATAIAERYMMEHPPETELFDWTSGVLMFALTELYRVTEDPKLRDYYKDYLDHHIDLGYDMFWSDSCPPALTALALLREEEDDPAYRKVVDDVLDYLETVPRTDEGGIWHNGPTAGVAAPGIWLDSLFMFGMVLNREGDEFENDDALALMAEQLGVFKSVLQSDQGLMVHADDWILDFDTDIYWARGNGWVVASLAEYLRVRQARGETDESASDMFDRIVAGALETQDESGMWWTVTNRPAEGDNYLETSAPALFAYGLARGYRYGTLGETERDAAKRAMEAVQDRIVLDDQERPIVTRISGGTEPGTFEFYVGIEQLDDLNYGVGAVILGLIETSGL
jgi:unsaturated rhamnogalacturonyl hydrolase